MANPISLWVGEIEHWADESYIMKCFEQFASSVVNVKIIRDKITGLPAGTGSSSLTALRRRNLFSKRAMDNLFRVVCSHS